MGRKDQTEAEPRKLNAGGRVETLVLVADKPPKDVKEFKFSRILYILRRWKNQFGERSIYTSEDEHITSEC